MDVEQALDGMTREQLVSLLYSILRRLPPVLQATTAPTDPGPDGKAADGCLVIDPTIDAWEHTGVYPQGFQPSPPTGCGYIENLHARPMPQFGGRTAAPVASGLLLQAHHVLPLVGRGNLAALCQSCITILLKLMVAAMRTIPGQPLLGHLHRM